MELQPFKPRNPRAGYSLPEASAALGVSYKSLLTAVKNGEVRVVRFAGRDRITQAEVARVRAMLLGDDTAAA
ncbi:hypothetical protein LRS10_16930 [Phenylobacterium sp. J426]|uniref:hypothetical protein n=1 Tax=Phenylobacterium sp. J426 TaxID=2898439 RepID=UPI002150962B|nr:hypothetical protein [Phenylobacterium sp. J426]MCR5875702.1 hypothetical protein [Phenylobacterium sp. J426]